MKAQWGRCVLEGLLLVAFVLAVAVGLLYAAAYWGAWLPQDGW